MKIRILENFIFYHEPDNFSIVEGFSDEIGSDINVIFKNIL